MTEKQPAVRLFQRPGACHAGGARALGLRNFVIRTSSAAAAQKRAKALEGLDLKPEDVDFVGETL